MKKLLALVPAFALVAALASAQTVTAPQSATFQYSAANLAQVTGFVQQYYLCTMSSTGVCTPATTPFQAGVTVPVASVTGTAPTLTISLTTSPESGVLASMPAGSAFVGTLEAIGNPAMGFSGTSAQGPVSNAFFPQAGTPAVPGAELLH
jgi:hypothetical protein